MWIAMEGGKGECSYDDTMGGAVRCVCMFGIACILYELHVPVEIAYSSCINACISLLYTELIG